METRNIKRNQLKKIQETKLDKRRIGGHPQRKQLCSRRAQALKNQQKKLPPIKMKISRSHRILPSEPNQLKQEPPDQNQLQIQIDENNDAQPKTTQTNNKPASEEEPPNAKKIQVYPSNSDVQTQTQVPNDIGFCDRNCPYIMTGMLCNPFCRFTPNSSS